MNKLILKTLKKKNFNHRQRDGPDKIGDIVGWQATQKLNFNNSIR